MNYSPLQFKNNKTQNSLNLDMQWNLNDLTSFSSNTAHHHNLPPLMFNHMRENCFGQRDGTNNVYIQKCPIHF